MKDTNLIHLLSTLSRKEMTRFVSFTQSPYHNKHRMVIALAQLLNEFYPNFPTPDLEGSAIWKKLGSPKAFSKAELSLIITYTQRCLLEFIAVEQFQNNRPLQLKYQLELLRNRGQEKLYKKTEKQQRNYFDDLQILDDQYFLDQYFSAQESGQNQLSQGNYQPEVVLDRQDHLDHFYLIKKFSDACELFQRCKLYRTPFAPRLFEPVLAQVANNDQYLAIPSVSVYYHTYKLLLTGEEQEYFKAKNIIQQYTGSISLKDQQALYNFLFNFCIQQVNRGQRQFLSEMFELYQVQLDQGLLLVRGLLDEFHYKNIVTNGLLLKEFDWVHKFIHEYKELIKSDHQQNAFSYNLANYYYHTKNYEALQDELFDVEYTDWRYALDSKVLLMKTYFELEEIDLFESFNDSFRIYIMRNKSINEINQRSYRALLKFTNKVFLLKISKPYTRKDKIETQGKKLKLEIEAAKHCYQRTWVLQQLAEVLEKFDAKS